MKTKQTRQTSSLLSRFALVAALALPFVAETSKVRAESSYGSYNSGVVFGSSKKAVRTKARGSVGFSTNKDIIIKKRGVLLGRQNVLSNGEAALIERRRLIQRRNEVVRNQELIERQIRAGNLASSGVLLNNQIDDTSLVNGGIDTSPACPTGFNCGFRLYDSGTGPRIITPGLSSDGSLPAFDGLRGPKIITLGN